MKALVHYRSFESETPSGIWWVGPNEKLMSFYLDGDMQMVGERYMLALRPDADLDYVFDYLDQRTPYSDDYALVELGDGETPQEYVRLLRGRPNT